MASRSGLPAPSKWLWQANSSRSRGRMRSASGAPLKSWPEKRSSLKTRLFAHHVDARRGFEVEQRRHELGIALQIGELQPCGLAEIIFEFHGAEIALIEAEAHALEAAVLLLGYEFHPFESVRLAVLSDGKTLVKVFAGTQQLRRRVADRLVERLHRHLFEFYVVDPHLAAVGDDDLMIRRLIIPAEFTGPLQRQRALRLLADLHAGVEHGLGEFTAQRAHVIEKRIETFPAAGVSLRRAEQQQQHCACGPEPIFRHGPDEHCLHDFS